MREVNKDFIAYIYSDRRQAKYCEFDIDVETIYVAR